MSERDGAVSAHSEARGDLVAVELPLVDFSVRRVFVVIGPDGGSDRGDHRVPCEQLMVLIRGTASVSIGPDSDHLGAPVALSTPGETLRLPSGGYVKYRLDAPRSIVMVLAEEVYRGAEQS
ncbi:MAG: WxcM-like domain-containing protein [Leifsonia sp.]